MRLITILALGCWAAAGQAAEDWQVDQPDRWWSASTSHHGKHGLGGVCLGAVSFEAGSLAELSRTKRYGAALGAGLVAGFGFEWYQHHYVDNSMEDPVDAGWVVLGSLAGAALADATNGVATIITRHNSVGVQVAWEW